MTRVLKVITAGDGAVGKTTLLHRYIEGKFLSNTKLTLGVEFTVKELNVDGTHVMLQLWDFGGQNQFRHLLQRYALGAKGAILMFDLTRIFTLENINEWVNICRKFNNDLPIILLGAKSDLEEQIVVDDDLIQEIENKYGLIDYLKVSSKDGRNINESIEILTRAIIKQLNY